MELPEKIYITNRETESKVTCGFWDNEKDSESIEYIRADLVKDLKDEI